MSADFEKGIWNLNMFQIPTRLRTLLFYQKPTVRHRIAIGVASLLVGRLVKFNQHQTKT
jgi:hypothetical protein